MAIRYVKIALVMSVALLGLFSGVPDFAALDVGYAAVESVVSMQNTHGTSTWKAIESPALIWLLFALIKLAEILMGVLCSLGAITLWRKRRQPARQFDAAKTLAILGCGVGLLLWFAGFIVIAGEWFAMYQWEDRAALAHAFRFVGSIGLILLFLAMPENE